jgi:L-fuconate dehydratase
MGCDGVKDVRITRVRVVDLRFPTSREQIGSDAVNKDPDYSAAYCMLDTDGECTGHGLTFTLGRGTDLVVQAAEYLGGFVVGKTLAEITAGFVAFSRLLTDETQFRWLGPEKGVIHLACGALINAVWDLWAKVEGKPVWRLLAEMPSAQLVSLIDFRYIDDALSPQEALDILDEGIRSGMVERLSVLQTQGYPAYTTSVGWFGYPEEKIRRLAREALADGWTHFKLKVGGDAAEDLRRGRIVREEIGWSNRLMLDANQKWGVLEAIHRTTFWGMRVSGGRWRRRASRPASTATTA